MINKIKLDSIIIFLYFVLLIVLAFPKDNVFNIILIGVTFFNGVSLISKKKVDKPKVTKYLLYAFINCLLFIIYAISYFISDNKITAFNILSKKFYFLFIPILIYIGPKLTEKNLNKILHFYVINLFLVSIVGIIKCYYLYSIGLFDNYSYDTMFAALGIHLTYYGVLILFAIYLLLSNLFKSDNNKYIACCVFLLCFFYSLLFIMATRVIIVLSFLIMALVLFNFFKIKRVIVVFFFAFILVGSVFYSSNLYVFTRFKNVFYSDSEKNTDFYSREIHWKSVISSLDTKKSLIVGHGIGNKQEKLNEEYLRNNFHGAKNNYNAHNQFLEVLVATGIVGLCIFSLNFTYMIYISIKNKEMILFVIQLIFVTTCITESLFERQLGIVTYLLINSLLFFNLEMRLKDNKNK